MPRARDGHIGRSVEKVKNATSKCNSGLSFAVYSLLLTAYCLLPSVLALAQQAKPPTPPVQSTEDALPASDWAPELLDGILSSPNSDANAALLRAAFAAGPRIIPQLERALQDDRTAEFAAQTLAFMGGSAAVEILSKLVNDSRDLGLRRFYYGALGEFPSPQATQVLLYAVNQADEEPDRTVTEAAILALTVRSDPNLVASLRQSVPKIKDVVIRDDLENALDVIEARARYLASEEGKRAGGSIEEAVRTYFIPALEPSESLPSKASPSKPARAGVKAGSTGRQAGSAGDSSAKRAAAQEARVKVRVENLTFSPDKTRALARVVFEDPSALANYDMVLQKQLGNWEIASVWLGSEAEKKPPATENNPAKAN